MTPEDVHGDQWKARIRAQHERLGDKCPCHLARTLNGPPVFYDDPETGPTAQRVLPGDQPLLVYAAGDCDWVTVVEARSDFDITVRLPDGRLYLTTVESLCQPEPRDADPAPHA